GGNDLPAGKDDPLYKCGGIRNRSDVLDHLHLLHVPAGQAIKRVCDLKKNEGFRIAILFFHERCSVTGRPRCVRISAWTSRMRTGRPSPNSVAPLTPGMRNIGSVIARTTISRWPVIRSTASPIAFGWTPITSTCTRFRGFAFRPNTLLKRRTGRTLPR